MRLSIHPGLRQGIRALSFALGAGATALSSDIPPAATAPEAAPARPRPRPRLSSGLRDQVVSAVPEYSPPAANAGARRKDPDVVELPRIIVREPKLPSLDDDAMLTPKGREEKLLEKHLPAIDRSFLNRYTLPLAGAANAVRAKFMEEDEKRLRDLDETERLIELLDQVDPAQAKELRAIRNRMLVREPVSPTTPSVERLFRQGR
ncbi:MAG: hypothetical protein A3G75_03780 [Verrucomicrobia bacterium RIFCSPLOWO2_12_FULL_64_8]|nr:MAG: hypothetical protein A3G75_03780 [Verrucomicrobia bacterium RIFCSPLOWO2_12_FULL_64_8]